MIIDNEVYIFMGKQWNKFELSARVVRQIHEFTQDRTESFEAGGALLGRYIIDSDDVVVDQITKPMEGDKQSRFRFFRSACAHQKRIDHAWFTSGGTCNYLGEWHSHPEHQPKPSILDLANWKRKLLFDQFDSDYLFFIILGLDEIGTWRGHRKSLAIEKLNRINIRILYHSNANVY